ncbi:MAG: transcription antitermination factor NusG [Saprospiraceae bacterium]|jgi:transcription antitermination factor NusG
MSKLISNTAEHYENHLDVVIPKWFAIYTHYKREKIAAKDLAKVGIQVYIPIQKVTRQYIRKVKKVELPLINHYVFVKITTREYTPVLQCPYVLNFVKFSKNLVSIPEEEIDLIKRILGEAESVQLDNIPFQKGDEVEVIGGNLTGLKGILIQKENNQYLSVRLTNIGISLNVSIAAHLLRKIK